MVLVRGYWCGLVYKGYFWGMGMGMGMKMKMRKKRIKYCSSRERSITDAIYVIAKCRNFFFGKRKKAYY